MKSLPISIDSGDWDVAFSKIPVSEIAHLRFVKWRLEGNNLLLSRVDVLRLIEGPGANWAVAKMHLEPCEKFKYEERLHHLAKIVIEAQNNFDVVWPSMALN